MGAVMDDSNDPERWDYKDGAKRWASVLDEEARPLTDEVLAKRSSTFRRGYFEYMTEEPLPEGHPMRKYPTALQAWREWFRENAITSLDDLAEDDEEQP